MSNPLAPDPPLPTILVLHTPESFAALSQEDQVIYRNIIAGLAQITELQNFTSQPSIPPPRPSPSLPTTTDSDLLTLIQQQAESNRLIAASSLRPPAYLATPKALLDESTRMYGDPNFRINASDKLRTLQQGKRSVMDYVIELRSLAQLVPHFNDQILADIFRYGLAPEIRNTMIKEAAIQTYNLEALITLATNLDNATRGSRSYNHFTTTRHSDPNAMDIDATTSTPRPPTTSRFRPRAPLTPEEKQYRIDHNLCRYCGKPNHIVANCPALEGSN